MGTRTSQEAYAAAFGTYKTQKTRSQPMFVHLSKVLMCYGCKDVLWMTRLTEVTVAFRMSGPYGIDGCKERMQYTTIFRLTYSTRSVPADRPGRVDW